MANLNSLNRMAMERGSRKEGEAKIVDEIAH